MTKRGVSAALHHTVISTGAAGGTEKSHSLHFVRILAAMRFLHAFAFAHLVEMTKGQGQASPYAKGDKGAINTAL